LRRDQVKNGTPTIVALLVRISCMSRRTGADGNVSLCCANGALATWIIGMRARVAALLVKACPVALTVPVLLAFTRDDWNKTTVWKQLKSHVDKIG